MTTVERHSADLESAAEKRPHLTESFDQLSTGVSKVPSQLNILADVALIRLGNQCSLDPSGEQRESWTNLTAASQTFSAIFAAASSAENSVECLINEEFVEIPATGPTYFSTPDRWQTALWLAMITRDFKRIRDLAQVSEATLRTNSDDFDEYVYSWIKALQAYLRDDLPDTQERMNETARLISPENTPRTSFSYLDKIFRPQFLLFLELSDRNEEGINNALLECLESHREFWTSDDEQKENPIGQIALAPLAFACVANDSQLSIEVTSDYLPNGFLKGTRLTEYQF